MKFLISLTATIAVVGAGVGGAVENASSHQTASKTVPPKTNILDDAINKLQKTYGQTVQHPLLLDYYKNPITIQSADGQRRLLAALRDNQAQNHLSYYQDNLIREISPLTARKTYPNGQKAVQVNLTLQDKTGLSQSVKIWVAVRNAANEAQVISTKLNTAYKTKTQGLVIPNVESNLSVTANLINIKLALSEDETNNKLDFYQIGLIWNLLADQPKTNLVSGQSIASTFNLNLTKTPSDTVKIYLFDGNSREKNIYNLTQELADTYTKNNPLKIAFNQNPTIGANEGNVYQSIMTDKTLHLNAMQTIWLKNSIDESVNLSITSYTVNVPLYLKLAHLPWTPTPGVTPIFAQLYVTMVK